MSFKHWVSAALVLAVVLGACKKKEEESAPQPVAAPEQPATPATGETPAPAQPGGTAEPAAQPATPATPATPPSPEATEKTLAALDDSIEKLAEGFGGALGGLPVGGKRVAASTDVEAPSPAAPEEPMPISRMQLQLDVASLRASPLGPMVQGLIQMAQSTGEVPANQACMIDLLNKLETAFMDVQFGEASEEPKAMVVALKTGSTKDEVVGCMRSAVEEGHEFAEVPVAGRTGYTVKETGEAPEMVMIEATPGNWLMGPPASVEAALQADPQADAGFQTLTGPLGAGVLRMTILPAPSFAALAGDIEADAPPEAQCVRGLFTAFKGGSIGLRLTPDFALSLALQNGSAAEAAANQGCLAGLWAMLKPMILSELGEGTAEAQQLQSMLGITPQQLLDSIQIQAQGQFTTVSVSLPADVLTKAIQLVGALAAGGNM